MDQLAPPRRKPDRPEPRSEEVASPKAASKAAPKADPVPPPTTAAEAKPGWRTRALMFGVPLALAAAGGWYWLASGGSVSTDNAYIQMDKVSVAAEVGGLITEVAIREGQEVAKGQLLFRIDGHPYALTVAQANAAIDFGDGRCRQSVGQPRRDGGRHPGGARGHRLRRIEFPAPGRADGQGIHHPRRL